MSAKLTNVLNIKNLIVFHAVVQHGSLTRAAKLMNRSQGQLSSIVKDIETACGTSLLNN
ncbi:LysR family transcriptional regulator [Aeromonas sp. MdU4]|uniref:LysR family transcriptional regulator n=1 Tax=Aeromonas sp. MdU4 TaxID=3342819 RepID=UPI0035B897C0